MRIGIPCILVFSLLCRICKLMLTNSLGGGDLRDISYALEMRGVI